MAFSVQAMLERNASRNAHATGVPQHKLYNTSCLECLDCKRGYGYTWIPTRLHSESRMRRCWLSRPCPVAQRTQTCWRVRPLPQLSLIPPVKQIGCTRCSLTEFVSCGSLPPLQPVLNPASQPLVAAESLEWDRCVPCFRNAARHSVHLVAGHRRAKPPD